MIESIKIRDFRGIKQGEIEQFKKINLLVGPNNSGKSAVLEAIYLACTASREVGLGTENDSINYSATVADRDLLGDHPMQRIWAKHNYPTSRSDLSQWESGSLLAPKKLRTKYEQNGEEITTLESFNLSSGFTKEEELITAIFGLESPDRVPPPEETRRAEIAQRIISLTRELDLLDETQRKEAESDLQYEEKEKSRIEKRQGEHRQKLDRLVEGIIHRGQDFKRSRLIYCWHEDLSYERCGDAAWIVKGDIPSARHTILYDISKSVGYTSRDFFEYHFKEKPDWLPRLADSFGSVFDLKQCVVQFLSAPDDDGLMQAWVTTDGQKPVSIDGYGDGARSAFKLLMALHILIDSVSDKEPGILIWEEPELFQNPKTLGRLLKEAVRLMKPKPIQVFIASHSLEVPAHFVRLVRRKQLKEDKLLVLRTRMLQGELLSVGFDCSDVEAWISMRKDLRVPSGDADSPLTYQMEEFDNEFDDD